MSVWRRSGCGSDIVNALRLNLSHMLHERSDSDAVHRFAQEAMKHRRWAARRASTDLCGRTTRGRLPEDVDCWVSASVGAPWLLASALTDERGRYAPVYFVDRAVYALTQREFFGATADLHLPPRTFSRVGVAVVVARPGHRSSQLEVAGPFEWTSEQQHAERALEMLLQRHATQLLVARALWAAPFEVTNPQECG